MAKEDWVTKPHRQEKPWGHEIWWARQDGKYCGKCLYVKAGESLSTQYHEVKEETHYIFEGHFRYGVGPDMDSIDWFDAYPGDVIHMKPGIIHIVQAVEDSMYLEASTTELDDVVRLEDRYGREGTNAY